MADAQQSALHRLLSAVGAHIKDDSSDNASTPHLQQHVMLPTQWAACSDGSVHVRCSLCSTMRTLRKEDLHPTHSVGHCDPTAPWGQLWGARTWCCADDPRGLRCSQTGPPLYANALADATTRWVQHIGYYHGARTYWAQQFLYSTVAATDR